MPISSVSIDNAQTDANSVVVDWTAEGLIFSGVAKITGFVEVVGSGFNPTILASTPIDESQGRDTASYATGIDVSDVPAGDYTVRVNWDDDDGNSGRPTASITIPKPGSGGGGGVGLTIGELSGNCTQSRSTVSPGEAVTFEVDVSVATPPTESYTVNVDLYVNGRFDGQETVSISPSGAGVAEFFVQFPSKGSFDVGFDFSNLRKTS